MASQPNNWGSGESLSELTLHGLQGSPMVHGEPDHESMPQKLPESNPDNPLYPFLQHPEPSSPALRRG
jgi:hypothetical protein